MSERKILTFPSPFSEGVVLASQAASLNCEQLDLFASDYERMPAITFLSLDGLDQDILLGSLIKNSVKTVIDLRSRAIFPKPRFDHKYVMSYFYARSMDYIECALSRSPALETRCSSFRTGHDRLEEWMSNEACAGVTTCIIDRAAIECGAVASFRHRIASRSGHWIEVHPRALF